MGLLVVFAIMNFSSPTGVGPLGVLFVFVSFYLISLSIMTAVFYWGSRLMLRFRKVFSASGGRQGMSIGRSYYFATIAALVPVILIGLQSVGALSIYQVTLVVIFFAVGMFYVAKRT